MDAIGGIGHGVLRRVEEVDAVRLRDAGILRREEERLPMAIVIIRPSGPSSISGRITGGAMSSTFGARSKTGEEVL